MVLTAGRELNLEKLLRRVGLPPNLIIDGTEQADNLS